VCLNISLAPENSTDKVFDVDPTEQVYMESMIYPLEKQIAKVSYKELFDYFAQVKGRKKIIFCIFTTEISELS